MHGRSAALVSSCLLAASLVLVGPRAVLALDAADLPNAIENAKTPVDHEAIAAYYDAEAKAARTAAEQHRKMAAAYGKHPVPAGAKGTRSAIYKTMPKHCDQLVASYDAAAKEAEALAAAHREEARAAE
jgi:hypothetical protein